MSDRTKWQQLSSLLRTAAKDIDRVASLQLIEPKWSYPRQVAGWIRALWKHEIELSNGTLTSSTCEAARVAHIHLMHEFDSSGRGAMKHLRTQRVAVDVDEWAECSNVQNMTTFVGEIDRTIRALHVMRRNVEAWIVERST